MHWVLYYNAQNDKKKQALYMLRTDLLPIISDDHLFTVNKQSATKETYRARDMIPLTSSLSPITPTRPDN